MSLRRRITAAVAVAVAAVSIGIGAIGYFSTRSKLYSQVRQELTERSAFTANPGRRFTQPPAGTQTTPTPTAHGTGPGFSLPPQRVGGAQGDAQFVSDTGVIQQHFGQVASAELPVTDRVRAVAAGHGKRFFFQATVDKTAVEILVVPVSDATRKGAVEIALPLSDVNSELSSLVVIFAAIAGGGVLIAGLIGLFIARTATAPIRRFTAETGEVTASLSHPRRIEEGGPEELHALARYFNQTLDALERSVQAQRHLIADASHELRTPMAALRSNIQIFIQADRLPPEDRVELQEAIIAEMDDLTQLVSDVLELARGAAPSDQREAVELDGLVRDAVGRTQRRAPGLVFELDIEPTMIVASPDQVGRAVMNIVDNARKWSPPDGLIEIVLRGGLLSVRDHGPGFGDGDLDKVFERFWRADDARRMPGSGLGLAIVKQAAEASGGEAVALNAPGGGALVRVRFGATVNNLLSGADSAATFAS